jgi:hypothetical protein
MKSRTITNTYLLIAAMFLTVALALPAAAEKVTVDMKFSGSSAGSAITNVLYPNTSNGEDDFAGDGPLGSFTYRFVDAQMNFPTPSSICPKPTDLHFSDPVGAAVLRFHDGSLLYLKLTQGDDCIDLTAGLAHCFRAFQITGGTGRFKNASGTLALTETVSPVGLFDNSGNPVFFATTGNIKGTISGVEEEQDHDEGK